MIGRLAFGLIRKWIYGGETTYDRIVEAGAVIVRTSTTFFGFARTGSRREKGSLRFSGTSKNGCFSFQGKLFSGCTGVFVGGRYQSDKQI